MTCRIEYDEMMSLKLDGLLDPTEEQLLDAHVAECDVCRPAWAALNEVHSLLWSSAAEPVPVPADFQAKVMSRVAGMQVVRPHWEPAATAAGAASATPIPVAPAAPATANVSVVPSPTRRLDRLTGQLTGRLPDYAQEWQARVASYVRGMAAVGLSLAGTAGVLLALVMWGALQVDAGPLTPLVDAVRTFFGAAGTWMRSIFVGAGPAALSAAGLVIGLLAFVGWQVVTAYQRAAIEQRGNTGYLEALP